MVLPPACQTIDPGELMTIRSLIGKLHLYLGLSLGLVLALVAASGTLLLYKASLEPVVYPERFPGESAGQPVPLQQIVAQIGAEGSRVFLVDLPAYPGAAMVLHRSHAGSTERVYVNPADGRVLDRRLKDEGLFGFLHMLHTHLLVGGYGERLLGFLGLVALTLPLTGAYLWWPGRSRLVAGFKVKTRPRLRLWRDLHKVMGVVVLPLLLLQIATGAAMALYPFTSDLLSMVTRSPAELRRPAATSDAEFRYAIDELLDRARRAVPEAQARWMVLPGAAGQPLEVGMKLQDEAHSKGRTRVYVDPATGEVLDVEKATQTTRAREAFNLLYPWHTGEYAGAIHHFLTALMGLIVVALMVTGGWFWWSKRRRRQSAGARLGFSAE